MHAEPMPRHPVVGVEDGPVLTNADLDLRVEATTEPFAAAAGVPEWWEPLFNASCNGSVFLSNAWMQSWLEVYGGDFQGLWIRWRYNGATVAGCLLVSRVVWKRFIPLRSLYLNATGEAVERTPLAEFNDILHLEGYQDAVAADFVRLVDQMPWDRLLLSGYEQHGLLKRTISMLPSALVQVEPRPAPYVDIAAISDREFEATLTGKVGSHIRRNTRLFRKKHGQLDVVVAANLEQAMQYFDKMSILHNTRWQSKGQGGSFSSSAVVDFHQKLIPRLWSTQGVDLVCVRGGQETVGYLYNFTSKNKVYVFQTGFEYGDDTRLSPGLLTHSLSIEHYRRRGFSEYDLLAGDSGYKRALAKHNRTLHWTIIYRNRSRLRFLLWLRLMKSRLASQIRSAFSRDFRL